MPSNAKPAAGKSPGPRIEALALRALSRHLLPESENDPYHLDYEVIEGYVEDRLDNVDRQTAAMHLEVCAECSAEMTDLRESLATMRAVSVPQPKEKETLRNRLLGFTRLPAFSTLLRVSAIVVLTAFAVIAAFTIWRLKSASPTQPTVGGRDLSGGSRPTPVQSPSGPEAGNPPLPNPGPSPYRLAESKPKKRLIEARQEMLALNDGPGKVIWDKSGTLVGLERLPRESQQAVKEALIAETINKPDVLDELSVAEISLRGSNGNEKPVRIVYPANTVIAEDRPLFEWLPSKTARAYRVEVGDANFHQVARSEELPASIRKWNAPAAFKRGMMYTWIVRVIKDGAERGSVSSASQGISRPWTIRS